MDRLYKTLIVIPCFNESNNLAISEYEVFLSSNPEVLICFVDDGSTDKTLNLLEGLKKDDTENVDIISLSKNKGKGEAVRAGMNHCLNKFEFDYIAYLDADLAVSLQECISLTKHLNKNIIFCFGSRIAKIGSIIDRRRSRFLIGRFIATLISIILSLKVYDTQCGCKVFTKALSEKIFANPFISKWLFDVEIFSRIIGLYGQKECLNVMLEIPLKLWVDRGRSKVKYSYFFLLFRDLFQIWRKHKQLRLN